MTRAGQDVADTPFIFGGGRSDVSGVEQLAEADDAVERCPQLMRFVGHEGGLES